MQGGMHWIKICYDCGYVRDKVNCLFYINCFFVYREGVLGLKIQLRLGWSSCTLLRS